jgi:hypothetical protein
MGVADNAESEIVAPNLPPASQIESYFGVNHLAAWQPEVQAKQLNT